MNILAGGQKPPPTIRPRITVDFDKLMRRLLDYDPGLTVKPRVDVDSLGHLPLLAFVGANGRMIANGHHELGWEWTLFLTLWTEDLEQGGDLTDTVYQVVHGLEDNGHVAGVGQVVSVEDVGMFDRIGSARLPDKQIVMYSAAFTVRVCPA